MIKVERLAPGKFRVTENEKTNTYVGPNTIAESWHADSEKEQLVARHYKAIADWLEGEPLGKVITNMKHTAYNSLPSGLVRYINEYERDKDWWGMVATWAMAAVDKARE